MKPWINHSGLTPHRPQTPPLAAINWFPGPHTPSRSSDIAPLPDLHILRRWNQWTSIVHNQPLGRLLEKSFECWPSLPKQLRQALERLLVALDLGWHLNTQTLSYFQSMSCVVVSGIVGTMITMLTLTFCLSFNWMSSQSWWCEDEFEQRLLCLVHRAKTPEAKICLAAIGSA